MAAHTGHSTRSRHFIKFYLATWAMLASGALAYLAVLTFPTDTTAPPPQARFESGKGRSAEVTVRQVRTADVKSTSEVQGSQSEVRKDVAQAQEAAGGRVENGTAAQTRLAAVAESVSSAAADQPPASAPETLPVGSPPVFAGEPPFRPMPEPEAGSGTAFPAAPIETGSIVQAMAPKPDQEKPKEEIVFGEAVVTRAAVPELAVQLATGTSLQAVKQSWGHLSEQHAALSTLQPRVIAPRGKARSYRLIAGPVATEADAARICTELGAGPKSCFVTSYTGAPL